MLGGEPTTRPALTQYLAVSSTRVKTDTQSVFVVLVRPRQRRDVQPAPRDRRIFASCRLPAVTDCAVVRARQPMGNPRRCTRHLRPARWAVQRPCETAGLPFGADRRRVERRTGSRRSSRSALRAEGWRDRGLTPRTDRGRRFSPIASRTRQRPRIAFFHGFNAPDGRIRSACWVGGQPGG